MFAKILLAITILFSSLLVVQLLKQFRRNQQVREQIKQELDKPKIDSCIFVIGKIIAKREYCYQSCTYTLVIGYNDKITEVKVDKNDKYISTIVGSEVEILICKE